MSQPHRFSRMIYVPKTGPGLEGVRHLFFVSSGSLTYQVARNEQLMTLCGGYQIIDSFVEAAVHFNSLQRECLLLLLLLFNLSE